MAFEKGHPGYNKKKATIEVETMEEQNDIPRFAPKKKRIPVGERNPMAPNMDLDPNFHYRYVRGKNHRVQMFVDGGYEIVSGGTAGEKNAAMASQMGSVTTVPSGDNEDRMYLMRIPKELYDEDQATKQGKVDEIEQQLKRKPVADGLQGEITGI